MTKSFLFPEIDSERAVPAPNENGLRRPALRRGFGKASVFLPAGRQVSGLFCGFRAVRPCRLLFLRGSGACAGGENRTHDSTLEVSNFATKLRPHASHLTPNLTKRLFFEREQHQAVFGQGFSDLREPFRVEASLIY